MYSQKIIAANRAKLDKTLGFPLREHSVQEVSEWVTRLADSFNEEGQPIRQLSAEEERFIVNEVSLSRIWFEYWAQRYCSISSDQARLVTLKLRNSQYKLLTKWAELEEASRPHPPGKVAMILVKARRVGATTIAQAAVAHGTMLRHRSVGLTASDIPETTLKLYQFQERVYKNLPAWMKPHMSGRVKSDHLYFDFLDSHLAFGTGNQKNPLGQGDRADFVHFTELATWLYPFQIDEDVLPAFRSSHTGTSLLMLESTARGGKGSGLAGGEYFHDQYWLAKKEKGDFRSSFLSWYDAPEMHTIPAEGVEISDTTRAVAARIKRDTGYECTKDQLAWYQIVREQHEGKGDLEVFLQEYPSSDEEAFQTRFRSVFTLEVRDRCRQAAKPPVAVFDVDAKRGKMVQNRDWNGDPDNKLLVWEGNRKGFTYVASVDASYGLAGGDNAAIEVIRVGNRREPDEQVAEFCGTIDPIDLASVARMVGNLYTDTVEGVPAKMAVEVNPGSPGCITQPELIRMGYSNLYVWKVYNKLGNSFTKNLGWQTTPSTRPILTEAGEKALREGTLLLNSKWLISEMDTFVIKALQLGRTKHEHADSYHDDRLMAIFIALVVAHEDDMLNIANDRMLMQKQKEAALARTGKPAVQYQALPMTWDQAMADWEERWC